MILRYLIFCFILLKPCTPCNNLFNYPRSTTEVKKKLPGIWNDLRLKRIIGACECGINNNVRTDPAWILFINLKTGVELNTPGMKGCVGTIINSNLIATSYNCVLRKSKRQINIFDLWNITIKSKSLPMRRYSTVTCDPGFQNPPVKCQFIEQNEALDTLDVPPLLTKNDLIVSSQPFGQGEKFKVLEIVYQEPYILDKIWRGTTLHKGQQQFKKVTESDILLFKLDADFTTNNNFHPICVPESYNYDFLNQLGEYYGAGMGIHPSAKNIDVNAGVVLWNEACESAVLDSFKKSGKIGLSKNIVDQMSLLCMFWDGSANAIRLKLGGGPLVLESDNSASTYFLAGVMTSLAHKNYIITATFTNILPVIKYLEYRADQHKSKWCRIPSALQLGAKIQSVVDEINRPWITGNTCGKNTPNGAMTKSKIKSLLANQRRLNAVDASNVIIEFLTIDNQVVESYNATKVCECTILPNYRGKAYKLNRNGICLTLYQDATCKNKLRDLWHEETISDLELARVRSFELCEPFEACYTIFVVLHKISIKEQNFVEAVEIAEKDTLVLLDAYKENWGKTSINFTHYNKEHLIPHYLEIKNIRGITAIQTSGIEIDHQTESIWTAIDKSFLESSMVAAYDIKAHNGSETVKFEAQLSGPKGSSELASSTHLFSCHSVNLTTITTYAKNVTLEYEAQVKIFGTSACSRRMSSTTLERFIPADFYFTGHDGEFTLTAAAKAKLVASFVASIPLRKSSRGRNPLKGCCDEQGRRYMSATDWTVTEPC